MSKKTTVRDDSKITENDLSAFLAFSQKARETSQVGNSKGVSTPLAEVAQLKVNWSETFRPFFRVRKTIIAILAAAKIEDLSSTKATADQLMAAHPEMLEAEMKAEKVIFSVLEKLVAPFSKDAEHVSTEQVDANHKLLSRLREALLSKDDKAMSEIQEEVLKNG